MSKNIEEIKGFKLKEKRFLPDLSLSGFSLVAEIK